MTQNSGSKSKLEDVLNSKLPGQGPNNGNGEPVELKSTLEKEIDAEDEAIAKELTRTRAEIIIADRQNRLEQIRSRQRSSSSQDTGVKAASRTTEDLVVIASGMLDKNMDPGVVGRLIDSLMGGTGSYLPPVGMPGAMAPSGGLTFENMMSLFTMLQNAQPKADPTLSALLTKLTDKIEAVEKMAAARPAVQSEPKTAFFIGEDGEVQEVPINRPIVLKPKQAPATGKSIEMVKEENRHAEEIEKLKVEKNYKDSIAQTIASIPEKVGRGLAGQALGEDEEETHGAGAIQTVEMEPFKCTVPDCVGGGKEMMVPKNASEITCPHCGMKYSRKEAK